MPAPAALIDALNNLQADEDHVVARQAAVDVADVALSTATTNAANAAHDLTAARATLAADLAAFEGQLESTYGTPGDLLPPPK